MKNRKILVLLGITTASIFLLFLTLYLIRSCKTNNHEMMSNEEEVSVSFEEEQSEELISSLEEKKKDDPIFGEDNSDETSKDERDLEKNTGDVSINKENSDVERPNDHPVKEDANEKPNKETEKKDAYKETIRESIKENSKETKEPFESTINALESAIAESTSCQEIETERKEEVLEKPGEGASLQEVSNYLQKSKDTSYHLIPAVSDGEYLFFLLEGVNQAREANGFSRLGLSDALNIEARNSCQTMVQVHQTGHAYFNSLAASDFMWAYGGSDYTEATGNDQAFSLRDQIVSWGYTAAAVHSPALLSADEIGICVIYDTEYPVNIGGITAYGSWIFSIYGCKK